MNEPEFIVVDSFGADLKEGTRVTAEIDPEGTVILITDPDGDADAEGRVFPINPKVKVLWDGEDGDDMSMLGEYFETYYDHRKDRYVCEDIEVPTKKEIDMSGMPQGE